VEKLCGVSDNVTAVHGLDKKLYISGGIPSVGYEDGKKIREPA